MAGINQSQTPAEQAELVQYEQNLAACYEAEYLLSIKLQEECNGSLGSGYKNGIQHSHPFYCDSYEVVWVPGINPNHLQAHSTKTVAKTTQLTGSKLMASEVLGERVSSSACCSGDTGSTLPITSVPKRLGNGSYRVPDGNSEITAMEYMDCSSSMSGCDNTLFTSNHHIGVNNRESLDSEGRINVFTIEDQEHFDGPSRKRTRFQGD